jgi:hypothetical protein
VKHGFWRQRSGRKRAGGPGEDDDNGGVFDCFPEDTMDMTGAGTGDGDLQFRTAPSIGCIR